MPTRHITLILTALAVNLGAAYAQYPDWQHSGSMFIDTTPDGANLPAAAGGPYIYLISLIKNIAYNARRTAFAASRANA